MNSNNLGKPNENKSSNSLNSTKEAHSQVQSGQKVKDPSSAEPKSEDDFQTSMKCLFWKRLG